ncbi:MAG: ferritin family protein [Lachnospiraceae bacterium]|nr:ferritin family protein [Lachnospiraceae bacterium]
MEEKMSHLENTCNFSGVKPIMMDLPYPPVRVKEKNQTYANLLSVDYCGSVSEMSAIAQYINHENSLSCEKCPLAKTILGIAMAEMVHLQKLGELIFLLGGRADFTAMQKNGTRKMWTPEYLNISENIGRMAAADIEAEKAAVSQYKMHMRVINDEGVNAVLARIIKDEMYHIMLLQNLT